MTQPVDTIQLDGGSLDLPAVLEAVRNDRRRRLLCHLRQSGSATLDELLDVLGIGTETSTNAPGIQRTRTTLYHCDLPKLEELGLIEVDVISATVTLLAKPDILDEWLDLAVRTDLGRKPVTEPTETERDEIRILVVDDDPAVTDILAVYLESNYDELSVTTTNSVEAAIEWLQTNPFDCIVSDLRMPVISGLDFLKVVRQEDPAVPFLLFTGHGSETVASEAVEHGITGYVVKSEDPDQFDDLARQILSAVATVRGADR